MIVSFLLVPSMQDLSYLVKNMNSRDVQIHASSQFSIYVANNVKMNPNMDSVYGWTPDSDDLAPWVQFDLEQVVTVWGVVVKLTGSNSFTDGRITSLKVATSGEGVRWSDVSDVLITNYNNRTMRSDSWFKKAARAKYWRINVLAWQNRISMKADLIGEIP